jgi:hypothetical protein
MLDPLCIFTIVTLPVARLQGDFLGDKLPKRSIDFPTMILIEKRFNRAQWDKVRSKPQAGGYPSLLKGLSGTSQGRSG